MLISDTYNVTARHFIRRLSYTMLPLIFSLAVIALLIIVPANEARAQDDITLLNGSPNEIDTVIFSITDHVAKLSFQEVGLDFWVRECTSCILSGVLTSDTVLISVDGDPIPIRLLRKDKKYEAIAIVYASGSGSLIERILLSEPL